MTPSSRSERAIEVPRYLDKLPDRTEYLSLEHEPHRARMLASSEH